MNSEEAISFDNDEPGGGCPAFRVHSVTARPAAEKQSISKVEDLTRYFPFSDSEISSLKQVEKIFPVRIPSYYLQLIRDYSDPGDPIRKQCVPSLEEIRQMEDEKVDPLGEEKTSPVSCLVHRYPDRVLLLVTSRCFMYCRHCTRKRLWKNKVSDPSLADIAKAIAYITSHKEIREVVVSGGDPLTLPSERLDYILAMIKQCSNVEVMRIGTRAPVVAPERIDKVLCNILKQYENLWVNVQFNHPREVTPQAAAACKKIQRCGIPISNQSVLLKGINDDPEVMKELCHKLQAIRVRPYYLFQCDRVIGTSHFWTSVLDGITIMERMRGWTGGMCVPLFVIDGEDGKGKIPISPNYIVSFSADTITFRNYKNELFTYRDSHS
ncbi:MAG: KamA family radical SAM protein [Candidatus Omnitrophica bacterium]|nr:KamA family radical SAM protein [Candidatus Omnitrophota bacterium]